jgi:HEAT repeat protein
LLHVVGLDPESSAQAQLGAISPYLNSSSRSDRLTAIALLATLAGEQGVAELGAALRDPDELVRAASATALGQRRVLGALNALTSALTDANTSVRRSGLRAITQLLDSLKPTSGSQLPRVAIAALRQRLQGAVDAAEKIIIQMVLLRCGESVSLKNIEEVLASGSEEQRLLVVELLPEDSPLLHSALRDPSAKVRFFAARRRVEQHARDAVPVLTEMLKRPGEEAILSYWLLRQLGMSAKAPEQLSEFLQRSSLPTRRDAVLLLAELPVNEALPFLLQACTDPAEVVRGAVAQSAWRLYEKTRDPRLFDLLSRLTTDPELPVRMKALALVGLLRPAAPSPVASVPAAPPAEAPRGEAPPAPAVPDPPPRADGGMAPSSLAQLLVLLPTGVRGRLENQRGEVRREVISGQQLQLPPDRYLLLSCGESVPITLHAGQSVTQRSPCSAEPLLREARQARRSGDYSSAQRSVEQALKRLDRTQAPQLYDLLRFEHGEIKAASGGLREALGDWNAVWERYRGSPPSEVPSIDKKFAELHGRVGRLTVHTSEGGPCRKVYDGLLMPGDGQKMTLGKAKLVFDIKPGVPTTKNLCGSGPK